jgi:hypothetical protein
MKFMKKLMGKSEQEKPKWDIKPPSERPLPKKQAAAVREPVPDLPDDNEKEKNPFLDDEMLDTMELEVDLVAEDCDNPYDTISWTQSFENDSQKLRNVQIGRATEKKSGGQFNPYDTGSSRRGWKK